MDAVPRHQCLIYQGSPVKQLPGFAAMIVGQLKANYRCMYFNSPAMVAGMRSYLAAAGVDVAGEVEKGSLIFSSEQNHLNNGSFDVKGMLALLVEAVEQATRDGYPAVWISGDMTWEFGNERNFAKLLEYERGLEDVFHRYPSMNGVCQYHQDTLPIGVVHNALRSHPAVYLNETLSLINPYYETPTSDRGITASGLRQMLDHIRGAPSPESEIA